LKTPTADIPCHRLVLAHVSPFFSGNFMTDMNRDLTPLAGAEKRMKMPIARLRGAHIKKSSYLVNWDQIFEARVHRNCAETSISQRAKADKLPYQSYLYQSHFHIMIFDQSIPSHKVILR
jgi:hypothetical protein